MYYSRRIRPRSLRFEWDANNLDKIGARGYRSSEAEAAVEDLDRVTRYSGLVSGERRVVVIGRAGSRKLLAVIVAPRAGYVRVVTAFAPTPRLRRVYRREEAL